MEAMPRSARVVVRAMLMPEAGPVGPLVTGLPTIDRALGRTSGVCRVSSDSEPGLTALAAAIAWRSAAQGQGVLWVSPAGAVERAAEVLISAEAKLDLPQVLGARVDEPEVRSRILAAGSRLSALPIWFVNAGGGLEEEIRTACLALGEQARIELVVVEGFEETLTTSLEDLARLAEALQVVIVPTMRSGETSPAGGCRPRETRRAEKLAPAELVLRRGAQYDEPTVTGEVELLDLEVRGGGASAASACQVALFRRIMLVAELDLRGGRSRGPG